MIIKKSKDKARQKRHARLRSHLEGTSARPRLAVYRSNKNISVQLIDDEKQVTIAAASTIEHGKKMANGSNVEAAKLVGQAIAQKALAAGVVDVVFDRGGYLFHGRVKVLADAAREAGLKF